MHIKEKESSEISRETKSTLRSAEFAAAQQILHAHEFSRCRHDEVRLEKIIAPQPDVVVLRLLALVFCAVLISVTIFVRITSEGEPAVTDSPDLYKQTGYAEPPSVTVVVREAEPSIVPLTRPLVRRLTCILISCGTTPPVKVPKVDKRNFFQKNKKRLIATSSSSATGGGGTYLVRKQRYLILIGLILAIGTGVTLWFTLGEDEFKDDE
jgi:hypothetical protein